MCLTSSVSYTQFLMFLVRKSGKISSFDASFRGKIRSRIPSLPVRSVWLSHGLPLSLGPASLKLLIYIITGMNYLVQCFPVLMAVIFYPCVVVHCTSSAIVDLFTYGGTSKRYFNYLMVLVYSLIRSHSHRFRLTVHSIVRCPSNSSG